MNFLIIFVCLFSISIANSVDKTEWTKFKQTYGKVYKSPLEELERFVNFKQNLEKINDHNKRYENGEVTYFLRVNHFSDWTKDEFSKFNTAKPPKNVTFTPLSVTDVPDSIDWRKLNVLNTARNQGFCGASYAFAAVGVTEALRLMKHYELHNLSEQNIIDCTYNISGNNGCAGGHDYVVYDHIRHKGINYYADYPYESVLGECRYNAEKPANISLTGYTVLEQTEDALKTAVGTLGPVSVMINIDDLMNYGGGIYNNRECSSDVNHFVIAAGYGNENGLDYWYNRNSFGLDWGEDGYFKIARNADNQCGFGIYSVFPNMD